MEAHTDLTAIALVTTVALICGLVLTRLRQPAVVGYILAGVVLGPTGFGLVANTEPVRVLAELGVIMLLFLVGLELSLRAFKSVIRVAMLTALLQIGFSLGITLGAGWLLEWPIERSILFGFVIALSSTAVAIKMLEDIGELRTHTGRITVGILIAQDLAIVPMLLLIDALGRGVALDYTVFLKLVLAVLFLGCLIWFLSRRQRLVLPLHAYLHRRSDITPLAALAFCFTAATISGLLGLSTAYGAFLAGLVIGSSTDRKATMHATHPIQSVLLVVFFLSIGLLIDLDYILDNIGTVLGLVLVVILVKTVVNIGVLKILGEPWERAFPAGVIMGQLGEFSFVLAAAGLAVQTIDADGYRLAIAVIALSLIASPLWLITARRFHAVAQNGISNLRTALGQVYREEIQAANRVAAGSVKGGRAMLLAARTAVEILRRIRPRRLTDSHGRTDVPALADAGGDEDRAAREQRPVHHRGS